MGSSRWDFSEQLAQYGPPPYGIKLDGSQLSPTVDTVSATVGRPTGPTRSTGETDGRESMQLAAAENYCRWVAETHYENFQIASRLLPRLLRRDFHNIYAYCRWSDDLGDEVGRPDRALELLGWWQEQLDILFAGGPNRHPVMIALAGTLERHALPKQPFSDLLSAFVQDQRVVRYDSLDELLDYCRRSADPVGRLVLGLAHAADDELNLRLSDSICTGLQLANFCQDMRRDAAMGRIYAPRELWHKHGVTEQQLLDAQPTTAQMQALLREFAAIAKNYLVQGGQLVDRVPRWLALDVRLFRAGGLAILRQIQRCNYDVWTRRPEVSRWHKGRLLVRALVQHWARRGNGSKAS